MAEDLLRTETREIHVKGSGETFAEAVQKCFGELRRKIYAQERHPLVYLEPVAFKVEKLERQTYTERFLEILFPRVRERYVITAIIEVLAKYVKLPERLEEE